MRNQLNGQLFIWPVEIIIAMLSAVMANIDEYAPHSDAKGYPQPKRNPAMDTHYSGNFASSARTQDPVTSTTRAFGAAFSICFIPVTIATCAGETPASFASFW